MKVLGINGSSRRDGNTACLINAVFSELNKEKIETELVQLAGENIYSCRACRGCRDNMDKACIIKEDVINEIIDKMVRADGIILGSPTYFANISSQMKAFIDRAGLVGMGNGYLYKRKPAAAVVAVRRGGGIDAFNALNHFFLINQMIIVGSSYWNISWGQAPGDVLNDEEGMMTMKNLGRNMAWLMKKLG